MSGIRAEYVELCIGEILVGAKEIWNKARFVAADDGRMTGKCADDDRVRETRSPERIRETELRGKIVDFIQKIFIRQIQSVHF